MYACAPEDNVREALGTMRREGVRRLPVVKPDGTLTGILSMNDIVLKALEAEDTAQAELSYGDVVSAFKGICSHHVLTPTPAREMLQKAATN